MPWFITYGLGVATLPAASLVFVASHFATTPTGWECGRCGWRTGMMWALPAWFRWRWHKHVVRAAGRCPR